MPKPAHSVWALAQQTKQLAEKAPPGPWRNSIVSDFAGSDIYDSRGGNIARTTSYAGSTDVGTFIAHSRTAAPQLADAVIEMVEAMKQWVADDGFECGYLIYDCLTKFGITEGNE